MTDKLLPLFAATPVFLFLYGLVKSVFEIMEVSMTVVSTSMMVDGLAGQNVIYVSAYLRALDSFFFYLGLAALVAAANHYLVRRAA